MLPYLWMLAGSFSFSIMGALAHHAGQKCEWQVIALFRALLVFVFVGGYALASGTKLILWGPRILWMRSLAGSISLIASFYALSRLQVSTVLTLTNTFPVWVAVLSWPMLGVLPAPRVWLAVAAGVVGVWFIEQPQGDGPQTALVIALFAALATAVAMLGLHQLHDLHPMAVVVHFSFVASVFCVAAFFLFPMAPGPLRFWHWELLLLLLGIGITASIGQLFLTKAFTSGDPSKVSVIGLSQVVFALFIDLWEGHAFKPDTLLGMFLIVAPTAWVMRKSD
jgi:drug/metabolite transporter (DMT)-like permease